MKNFIGKIYKSKNFGEFIILEEVFIKDNMNDRLFKIKFLDTGYETIVTYSAIRHGSVKDYLYPSVAGVGFVGYLNVPVTHPYVIIFYKTWNDMINRYYNKNDYSYKFYGGIGVKVDPRWFNFSIFLNDIQYIPGYYDKLKNPTEYNLDKDYKQINIPKNKRIYSKDTCIWLSEWDNVLLMNREKGSNTKYYGVIFRCNTYYTRIDNKLYGRFTTAEAAANLFNYLYPLLHPESKLNILNNVEYIPIEDLSKYEVKRYDIVSSTTISEESTT